MQLSLGSPRGLGSAVTTGELLDAACSIDEFLFPGEKRMASGADTDFNVTPGRPGMVNRAARANHVGFGVFRMDVRFHVRKGARNLSVPGQFRKR
jgi:hypothetical protein